MGGAVVSRLIVLVGGTLFPAYASYKAIKSSNARQYLRWMMYWIVFALFITVETFTDILFSWVPFYYEIKVGFIIWLLSPYTKGAAFLYKKFIHPYLSEKEPEIDSLLTSAKEKGYTTVLNYGSRGINVATTAFVSAAVKGQTAMSEKLKSFSVNDISRLSDDTPIHSMSPLSAHNPPVQREIHRRSPHEGPSRPSLPAERQISQETEVDMETFEVISSDTAPPGGLAMNRAPSGDDYGREPDMNIGSQYKAYSMMNLARTDDQEPTTMTRMIEFISTPPETSVDDSVIPDETTAFERGDSAYSTLPRQRKSKKSKKNEDPSSASSLRRSKRRPKSHNYEESDEEQYRS